MLEMKSSAYASFIPSRESPKSGAKMSQRLTLDGQFPANFGLEAAGVSPPLIMWGISIHDRRLRRGGYWRAFRRVQQLLGIVKKMGLPLIVPKPKVVTIGTKKTVRGASER